MGNTSSSSETQEGTLLLAVQELTRVVGVLTDTIKDDYPKRNEIEQRFETKDSVRQKRTRVVIGVVLAIIMSYFASVSTASYCFLQGPEKDPGFCHIMPGYDTYQARVHKFQKAVFGE